MNSIGSIIQPIETEKTFSYLLTLTYNIQHQMNLVSYSSSDSDEETQRKNTEVKRVKLSPVKIQLKNDVTSTEQINSNETDRIRLFPHERGNWALSIYSFVDCSSHLDTLIDDLVELFNQQHDNLWKRLVELHISLSKTIPIRFHHIESIRQGIQTEFATTKISFATRIQSISILNNEDQSTYTHTKQKLKSLISLSLSRSFLVFTLDQHQEFVKLVSIIDKVLQVHRYPGYYEVKIVIKIISLSQNSFNRIHVFILVLLIRLIKLEMTNYQRTGKINVK